METLFELAEPAPAAAHGGAPAAAPPDASAAARGEAPAAATPDAGAAARGEAPAAAPPAARARPERRTSKGIAPGDIVEVDRRGRRFQALVTGIHQRDSGHHDLDLRPLDPRVSYYTATIRDVVAVWRRVR
ncbi:MAG TPA: hypothetical protein VLA98_12135 [Solirubrobacteraceae bacterium]|nr:hypothetical protein [Solirubrobacteraceae bacterium]